ncbi:16516_t:CDS:2 [Rhizophagus irregularis]|nr:16516_t:CDS:2 [Rhizophagus irregularis]
MDNLPSGPEKTHGSNGCGSKAKMIVKNTIEFVEQKKYLEDKGNIDDQLQNLQNINQAIAHKTSKRVIPNSNNKSKSNSKKLSLNH